MKKTILGLLLVFAFGLSLKAQKLGYVNIKALKSEMPEVSKAESDAKLYRMLLFEQGVAMVKELQNDYTRVEKLVACGYLSPKYQGRMVAKLQIKQYEISLFEVRMEEMIQAMEARLMNPILARIDSAIQAVAFEHQFESILQKGSPLILYNDHTADVSGLVREELGL